MVIIQDEQGNQIEQVIPKSQFRKKVALFFFVNKTGDSKLDWLQYGFVSLLEFDFVQDPFLDMLENKCSWRDLVVLAMCPVAS